MADLGHVRWIGGGTGAGKSTVTRILASRTGAVVYDGDRPVLVDWFGLAPRDVHALTTPEHVAFLLPSQAFRRGALGPRFADPVVDIDGTRDAESVADDLARRFRL